MNAINRFNRPTCLMLLLFIGGLPTGQDQKQSHDLIKNLTIKKQIEYDAGKSDERLSAISPQQAVFAAMNRLTPTMDGYRLENRLHSASFTPQGVYFKPVNGGPNWRWQLKSIGSQSNVLSSVDPGSMKPILSPDQHETILYPRYGIIEQYLAHANHIEQQFVISEPLELFGENLVITGKVASSGSFEKLPDQQGWQWRNTDGVVSLGDVTVFDAIGNELPASMFVTENETRIEVDGASMARAIYPVTVDPEIGTNDFRISDMGTDGDANFDATVPDVAYNSTDNEYLVVWRGDDGTDEEFEIFGQRIDAETGLKIGTNDFRISHMGTDGDASIDAYNPAVAYNSTNNEFLVVWQGDGVTDEKFEIYYQLISNTGAEIGVDSKISTMGGDALEPDVAYNSTNNEYLVVWRGDDISASMVANEFEIFGQRLSDVGAEIGTDDFRISVMGDDTETDAAVREDFDAQDPAVAYNSSDNEFLVVWHGDLTDDELEIFGQRLSNIGAEIGTDFRISDMGPDGSAGFDAQTPAIAYNATNSEYLVVWSGSDDNDSQVSGEFEIFAQRIDADGSQIGANDFRISDMGGLGDAVFDAHNPDVAYSSIDNEYKVVWESDDNTGSLVDEADEIFAQRINAATGAEVGVNDFRISDMGANDDDANFRARMPALAFSGTENEFLIVWQGDDDSGLLVNNEDEIFGQLCGLKPEMDVAGGAVPTPITDGDEEPSLLDGTDFGNVNVLSGSTVNSFTISNTAIDDLNLTGIPIVDITGDHATDFTVTSNASSPVSGSGNTSFEITFDPSAPGLRTASVSIANNDVGENPYNFAIKGTGLAPEIDVLGGAGPTSIPNGDSDPEVADDTDFGSVDVSSGVVNHTFTIKNTGNADLILTSTATSGGDFAVTTQPTSPVASNGGTTAFVVTFNPSATGERNSTVTIANNDSDENPYTFHIKGTGTTKVNLYVDVNAGTEADETIVTATAMAASAVSGTQTVNIAASGTGITTGDGTLSATTVTINDGETSGNVTYTILDDALVEGTETAVLTISSPTPGITLGTTTTQNVTITDNNSATVAFKEAASSTGEDGADKTVTVVMTTSSTLAAAVTVDVSVTDGTAINGTDYATFNTTTVTFDAGSGTGTEKTVTIDPTPDELVEGDETVELTLALNSGVATLGGQTTHTLTINDAESASVAFKEAASSTGEDDGAKTVTVELTTTSTLATAVTVDVSVTGGSAVNGTDYGIFTNPTTVTFAVGSGNGDTQTVTITPTSDTFVEGDETVELDLSAVTGPANLGTQTTHTLTINDAESASVAFKEAASSTGEDDGAKTVTVELTTTSTLATEVTVDVSVTGGSAVNGTDYGIFTNPTTVTFAVGSGNGDTQTVTITPTSDTFVEGDETVELDLSAVTGPANLGIQTTHTLTINDAESASVAFQEAASSTGEDDGAKTVTVELTTTSTLAAQVTVDVSITGGSAVNGTDYTQFNATTVTFAVGSGNGDTQTVTITPTPDTFVEGDETVELGLSTVTGPASLGIQTSHTLTINDAESASVAFKEAASSTGEDDGAKTVTVELTTTSTLATAVTVDVSVTGGSAVNGTDYGIFTNPTTVTFAIGSGNGDTQTVTITPTSDTFVEGDETVELGLSTVTGPANLGIQTTHTLTINDAESASVAFQEAASSTGEDDGAKTVTVELTTTSTLAAQVTVDVSITGGSAVNGTDYTQFNPTTVTFVVGSGNGDTQTVTITPTSDTFVEGDETVELDLSTVTGPASLGTQTTHTLTINDAESASMAFKEAASSTGEDDGAKTVVVELTTTSTLATAVTVDVSVTGGSAVNGTDYTQFDATTVTFAVGSGDGDTQTVTITPTPDTFVEGDETVELGLSAVTGPANLGTQTSHTLTINDAESASVAFKEAASSTGEDDGAKTVTVELTTTSTLATAVTVDVSVTGGSAVNGTDYTQFNRTTVTFAIGSGNGDTQTVTITPTPDTFVEGDETVELDLSAVTGPANLGTQTTHTLTINDAESASVAFKEAASSTGEDDGAKTVTVELTTTSTLATTVTVDVSVTGGSAVNGTDYTQFNPTTVTFAIGSGNGDTQTVTISPTSDTFVEGDETVELGLSAVTGPANLGTQTTHTLTINDAESASVAFKEAASSTGEDDGAKTVTVELTTTSTLATAVTVDVSVTGGSAVNGTDYSTFTNPTTVTFAIGSGNGDTQTVTITPTPDTFVEGDETVELGLSAVTGPASLGTQTSHTLTINDAESASVAFKDAISNTGEDDGAKTVTVELTTTSTLATAVTVDVSITGGSAVNGTDYTQFNATTVTFAIGSGNGDSQTVSITPTSDTFVEGDETIELGLSTVTGPANLGTQTSHTLTINDAESASVAFKEAASSTGEDGGAKTVTVELTTTSTLATAVTVDVSITGGSAVSGTDYGTFTNPTTVTFAVGSGNGDTQPVTITPTPDTFVEGDETIELDLSTVTGPANLGTQTTHTLTINDAESASVAFKEANSTTGEDGGAKTLTVELTTSSTIAEQVTVEVSVTGGSAVNGTDYSIFTNPTTVTFAAGSGNGATQTVTITPTPDTFVEGDETVILGLDNATGAATIGSQSTHTLTIIDPALVCLLTPATDTNQVGTEHSVTITLSQGGNPVSGATVNFEVIKGPNNGTNGPGTSPTNGSGQATFTYTSNGAVGTDSIKASGTINGVPFECFAEKVWENIICTLVPATDQNQVGHDHTVTATVTHNGNPAQGVDVTFHIFKGPNSTTPNVPITTNASGEAVFTYTGNGGVGVDSIRANGMINGVPFESLVEKKWVESVDLSDFIGAEDRFPFFCTTCDPHYFEFEVRIQNTTTTAFVQPLFVEFTSLTTVPPGSPITMANADGGGPQVVGAYYDYSDLMGPDNRLEPGELTEYKLWRFNDPLDANFFFDSEVRGVFATSPMAKASSKVVARLRFFVDVKKQKVTITLLTTTTDVEEPDPIVIPTDFVLHQNYPNPFNPETTIRFELPQAAEVIMNVYNIHGQLVRQLVQEQKQAGFHETVWDARDDNGRSMASGVYLYRIKAGAFIEVRKLMLIR